MSNIIEIRMNLKQKIIDRRNEIEFLKKELHRIETQLYHSCSHEWVIDPYVISEHTEYICKKCDLGKYFN